MKTCIFNQISQRYVIVDEQGYPFGQGKTEEDAWASYQSLKKFCLSLALTR